MHSTGEEDPFIIGVLGEDLFGSYLDETVNGEKVNGHPLIIKRYSRPEDVRESHILFIGETNKYKLRRISSN